MTGSPFPDGAAVETPFPLTPEQKDGPRGAWPWLPGTVLAQVGPDEWDILMGAPALALEDDDGELTYPVVFRDSSEPRPAR